MNEHEIAYERVLAARSADKIPTQTLINGLVDNFVEMHGDRLHGDDEAIIGGIGWLDGMAVTVIGVQKGQTIEENLNRHFGSPMPWGYRKALRLMKQAEKFHRPILTLVNTPGAYPDMDSEDNGQGAAIAQCLLEGMQLKVPYISVIVGEGGSGGALALACGDQIYMFENSIYSILSPEGYASIMWKDASLAPKAALELKLTPNDLLEAGIIDRILPESETETQLDELQALLKVQFSKLQQEPITELLANREQRYRKY